MPVSFDHLGGVCQVWDGRAYDILPIAEAKKAEEAGRLQITTNLTAAQLKRPEEFAKARRKKSRSSKQDYGTREMRASETK